MERIASPTGATVSYDTRGSGPPLVLVHGGFSDHETNWAFVMPLLTQRFTVHAVARRGRGETDASEGHGVEDAIDPPPPARQLGGQGGQVLGIGHVELEHIGLRRQAPRRAAGQAHGPGEGGEDDLRPLLLGQLGHAVGDGVVVQDAGDQQFLTVEHHR